VCNLNVKSSVRDVFTRMQDEGFPLNLVLKYARSSLTHILRTKLVRSEPDHVEPNQGLCHKIILCRQKTS
jgi:hypothetical protein